MRAELLIPILVPLGFFTLIFGIVYMQKKENLAMIERGMNPKQRMARGPEPFRYLKWGLLMVGAGIGLFCAYILHKVILKFDDEPEALYFSLIAIGGGIGLITSYRMEMKELRQQKDFNRPEVLSEL
jgi:hypothetical protein